MMRVLVSLGVLMNLLLDREPFLEDTLRLLEIIESGQIEGYVTEKSLHHFLHEATNNKGFKDAIGIVNDILYILKLCPDEYQLLRQAKLSQSENFEAIEQLCAETLDLCLIVPEEPEEWVNLPVLSVKKCLERRSLEEQILYPKGSDVLNLWEWFKGNFKVDWQSVSDLLSPQLRPAFRNTEDQQERSKLIDLFDLGLELAGNAVVLIITVRKIDKETASVRAQVYPRGEALTLPPNLKLSVLTATGEVFTEVTARSNDEFIQYQFNAQRGDDFGIQLSLGEACIIERFHL
ncbi:DUF1822 family protein [Moorena sp. SIO3H5]|uniref:DUF1822 family protein n=1 Tax=Moorena sp. SIO3H5 TaxID=2607834 RepID=UPI0013B68EE1|nr:DUF1822 family protein [Moorena sp. SIO3H5]NEO71768.1 DUF1822 family protein [Moorena sp. SIO3H5]